MSLIRKLDSESTDGRLKQLNLIRDESTNENENDDVLHDDSPKDEVDHLQSELEEEKEEVEVLESKLAEEQEDSFDEHRHEEIEEARDQSRLLSEEVEHLEAKLEEEKEEAQEKEAEEKLEDKIEEIEEEKEQAQHVIEEDEMEIEEDVNEEEDESELEMLEDEVKAERQKLIEKGEIQRLYLERLQRLKEKANQQQDEHDKQREEERERERERGREQEREKLLHAAELVEKQKEEERERELERQSQLEKERAELQRVKERWKILKEKTQNVSLRKCDLPESFSSHPSLAHLSTWLNTINDDVALCDIATASSVKNCERDLVSEKVFSATHSKELINKSRNILSKRKVFGCGLSRTGTHGLSAALRFLGYKTVYGQHRLDAHLMGKEWKDICVFDNVDAAVDVPTSLFCEMLAKAYPSALFVLTIRNVTEWYNDVLEHEAQEFSKAKENYEMQIIRRARAYGSVYPSPTWSLRFMEHNARVLRYFEEESVIRDGASRLLVFDSFKGDGWSKLCKFLDCDVRDEKLDFPRCLSDGYTGKGASSSCMVKG